MNFFKVTLIIHQNSSHYIERAKGYKSNKNAKIFYLKCKLEFKPKMHIECKAPKMQTRMQS